MLAKTVVIDKICRAYVYKTSTCTILLDTIDKFQLRNIKIKQRAAFVSYPQNIITESFIKIFEK